MNAWLLLVTAYLIFRPSGASAISFVLAILLFIPAADARELKEVDWGKHRHDRFDIEPKEVMRDYGSFIVSFDSADDDNGDGTADSWAIPVWVMHEVRRVTVPCIKTIRRPKWFTDKGLAQQRIAPYDATYQYSRKWRDNHPDWYERGHLASKLLVERMGPEAAWNTFTLLNAVPQRRNFNKGPWFYLEIMTGAWAQRYGWVWIAAGPIIVDGKPSGHIGQGSEIPAAIPDALFKIVARQASGTDIPEVLAFIYPQVGPGYTANPPISPSRFLVSVSEVEQLTGLNFFSKLTPDQQSKFESTVATALWPVEKEDYIEACRP
ncbi:MAG: DNA/RNA non-specific endonuclease [Rhodospirillaceae bacterium]|nr:DNA/RNA non-specific endonuclease [Rhodospirillaceae bacterium]